MMKSSQKNVLYFYSFRILQILFPLVYIMFIARHLTKSDFGYVALSQSISLFCASIVEYGFNYSATRDISKNRNNILEISRIFYGINVAKLILLPFSVVLGLFWANLSHIPTSFWPGIIFLIIYQGFGLLWYFQGIDRVLPVTIADIVAKFIFLFLVLLLELSGSGILCLLGLIQVVSLIFVFTFINKLNKPKDSLRNAFQFLSEGRNLFIFRIGSLIYGGASTAILGLIMPAGDVAIYSGADRLFRAAAGMTAPIGDAYFANISHALKKNNIEAKELFLRALKLLSIITMLIFCIGELMADYVIKVVLGKQYFESVEILRILLLSVPLIGLGTIIFVLYLLPRGYDKYFALSTTVAGVWLILSSYFLVSRFGIRWMAYSIVISEIIICFVGIFAISRHRRTNNG